MKTWAKFVVVALLAAVTVAVTAPHIASAGGEFDPGDPNPACTGCSQEWGN